MLIFEFGVFGVFDGQFKGSLKTFMLVSWALCLKVKGAY